MCIPNNQRFVNAIMKHVGKRIEDVLTKDIVEKLIATAGGYDEDAEHCEDKLSVGALLISYAAEKTDIGSIEPAVTIRQMKKNFMSLGNFYGAAGSVVMANPSVGHIVFFTETNYNTMVDEPRVGVVYRSDVDKTNNIWAIYVNYRGEICTTIMRSLDLSIYGYGAPYYGPGVDSEETCDPLRDELGLFTNGIPRYCGEVISAYGRHFCHVLVGPGEDYCVNPKYPRLYEGNFVKVYEEFSDRTPGEGDHTWLLVGIDNYAIGYVLKEYIKPAEYQAIYPSGDVGIHEIVDFVGGVFYETPYDATPLGTWPSMQVKILEINLNSANQYRVVNLEKFAKSTWESLNVSTDGFWVRANTIRELRK